MKLSVPGILHLYFSNLLILLHSINASVHRHLIAFHAISATGKYQNKSFIEHDTNH